MEASAKYLDYTRNQTTDRIAVILRTTSLKENT